MLSLLKNKLSSTIDSSKNCFIDSFYLLYIPLLGMSLLTSRGGFLYKFDDGIPWTPPALFELLGVSLFSPMQMKLLFLSALLFIPIVLVKKKLIIIFSIIYTFLLGQLAGFDIVPGNDYVFHSKLLSMWYLFIFSIHYISKDQNYIFKGVTLTEFSMRFFLAMAYFSPLYLRYQKHGFSWFIPETAKGYILEHAVILQTETLYFMASHEFIYSFVAYFLILFELFSPIMIFTKKLDKVFAVVIILFHLISFIVFNINFLHYHLPALLILLNPDKLVQRGRQLLKI